MKSILLTLGLASFCLADSSSTVSIPSSVDAASYLSEALTASPTWATGKYETSLATALYSVATSFVERKDYITIIEALYSAAGDDSNAASITASMASSGFNWGDITTAAWYKNVPKSIQGEISSFDSAFEAVQTSIYAEAVSSTSKGGAAAPRCTGMALAGVAAGVAVAGML